MQQIHRINVFRKSSDLGDIECEPTIVVCTHHLGKRKANNPQFIYLISDIPLSGKEQCQDCIKQQANHKPRILTIVQQQKRKV